MIQKTQTTVNVGKKNTKKTLIERKKNTLRVISKGRQTHTHTHTQTQTHTQTHTHRHTHYKPRDAIEIPRKKLKSLNSSA